MTAAVLARYSKAVAAGFVGGLTAAGTALADGHVSAQEAVGIALAFVLGLGIVSAAPANRDYTDDDVRDDPTALED